MTARDIPSSQGSTAIHILLAEDDPVFRLGVRVCLEPFDDIAIVAEAATGTLALEWLDTYVNGTANTTDDRQASANDSADSPVISSAISINLVVLSLELGRITSDPIQGLTLCQQIRVKYPSLPVLILSASPEPLMQTAAQRAGANGYVSKQAEVAELMAAIRRVAGGQSYWMAASPQSRRRSSRADRPSGAFMPSSRISPLALLRRNLRISGIWKIEHALDEVTQQLQTGDLSLLDQAIWAGRHRELRAARWLVSRLLATPNLSETSEDDDGRSPRSRDEAAQPVADESSTSGRAMSGSQLPVSALPIVRNTQDLAIAGMQASLFDSVLAKLQTSLRNQTEFPLEIDILQENKRRELLSIVLRKLVDLLDELRYSDMQPRQIFERRSQLLLDLWLAVISNFFGKYYIVQIDNVEVELVEALRQDADSVQIEILDKIPFADDLLAHLLFQEPLEVDSIPRDVGTPEAMARAEALLDNLIIQVANAVIQPLLNRFSDVETIKQNFYDRRLMTSREIARFRNELSWKYRVQASVGEPRNIFESQYRLLIFRGTGIKQLLIYAPRRDELEQLSGIPLIVTFALEVRDATAPRLRALISWIGGGVIYLLTDVIGRGIGLIGRGILKGIGSAWNETRVSRNGDRPK
ncbi:MAG: DUF3685 domain-containing protein [Elainellaceae cyanobacterium]